MGEQMSVLSSLEAKLQDKQNRSIKSDENNINQAFNSDVDNLKGRLRLYDEIDKCLSNNDEHLKTKKIIDDDSN